MPTRCQVIAIRQSSAQLLTMKSFYFNLIRVDREPGESSWTIEKERERERKGEHGKEEGEQEKRK
jgi:hypothetical protein